MSKIARLLFQGVLDCHTDNFWSIDILLLSPLAVKPEEAPPLSKRTGFWDSFAANWAAKKQADAATAASAASNEPSGADDKDEDGAMVARGQESQDGQITMEEVSGGGGEGQSSNNSFSKYMSLGGGSEEVSFKWNFVTSKLAELKTKAN